MSELPVVQQEASLPMTIQEMKLQVNLIQEVMRDVMKEGEHYGTIPGCGDKKTLLKPGSEKLILTFQLVPVIEVQVTDFAGGHREYMVLVTMYDRLGRKMGMGAGSCSTMEGKYRFRSGDKKITDKPVPKEYWTLRNENPAKAQALIGKGNGTKKGDDSLWYITEGGGAKVEHDNPADYYNTCLKMAKKRAQVDATLTVTAASDIFTQDIEDMPEVIPGAQAQPQPQKEEIPEAETEDINEPKKQADKGSQPATGGASDKQRETIGKMLGAAGYANKADRLDYVNEVLRAEGFEPVTKSEDLTGKQASKVIGKLIDDKKLKDAMANEAPEEKTDNEPF